MPPRVAAPAPAPVVPPVKPPPPRRPVTSPSVPSPSASADSESAEPARPPLVGTRVGRAALALASAVTLMFTGYGYLTLANLTNGLATDDVIKNGGGEKPTDGAVDILLVGLDSRTDAHGNPLPKQLLDQLNAGPDDDELDTDTLIVARIPNDTSKPATMISIPRDSYVTIPGGYGKHKINSAYARARNDTVTTLRSQGVTDAKQVQQQSLSAGRKELIDTVSQLTGITIDHYAEVNLYGFSEITKAIGGVDVCLNAPARDKDSGANFPAGEQKIQGIDALKFVRQRHGLPNGDLDRIKRQQVFMAGLAKAVLSAGTLTNPSKLSDLIDAIKNAVLLDKDWDLVGFAQQLKGFGGGGLHFQTIPTGRPDLDTPNDGQAVEVDPAKVRAFVGGLIGQPVSAAAVAGPSGTVGADSQNSDVTVEMRNANGTPGLADRVLSALVAKGFTAGDVGNAPSRTKSVILYPSGGAQNAQRVSDALGGGYTMQRDDTDDIPAGHVRIFLSTAYDGPGTEGFAGPAQFALDGLRPAAPPPTATTTTTTSNTITADGVTCIN